ncbi:MAG: LytTR family DNA-binding domain-containing protein [Eubacteriales bacterium]|nr:LytTR family DNA-binding domain-containing protein [Eubacteriales bacterium]
MERVFQIAICDDEVEIGKLIEKKILEYSVRYGIEYRIQIFRSGRELLDNINGNTDILFLDVEMPGLNGIETAVELRKRDQEIKIVYLSGFREYVFESFKVQAFRYLLKPLKDSDFKEVMDELCKPEETSQYLSYTFGSEHYSINFKDILYIEGMRGKIFIHCADAVYRWRGALSVLYDEMNLREYHLFLIHQSYVINMDKIIRYNSKEVVLEGNLEIPISKHRLNEFKQEYIRLWGNTLF